MHPTTDAPDPTLHPGGAQLPHALAAARRLLRSPSNGPVAVLVAFAGPLAAAAIMVALRAHVANTSLALIMVAVVVATLAPGRRVAALVAGASAGVWFDFFLTRPYESFTITRSADLQTTLLLFAVAVAVGELAAHNRRNRTHAALTTADLRSVQTVASLLASGATRTAVTDAVAMALKDLLALDVVRFEDVTDFQMPYLERAGSVRYSNYYAWDHTREGLPAKTVTLPVEADGRLVGRFALKGPALGVPVTTDSLLTAITLADLTAAAITRTRPAGHPV